MQIMSIYLVSMSAYSQKIPFPKCDFSCYIDNSENKIYAVSIHNGRYHFRKRYATYRIAKKQYKKISTTDFQSAMECIDRLVKTATK